MEAQKIISVKEVFNEIESYRHDTDLKRWAKENEEIFQPMSKEESLILSDIFKEYPKFQYMLSKQKILQGKPVADPLLVAKAIHIEGTVISEETSRKKDGTKIPNLCAVKKVPCLKLRDFIKQHHWSF